MDSKESISFTFPEIHEHWLMLQRRSMISMALWLMIILATIANRRAEIGDDWLLTAYIVFCGVSLPASLMYWSRQNKLSPRINRRFAIEFMLRTGYPSFPEDLDILQVKRTVAARDEEGNSHLWSVKLKGDVFTVAPA